MVNGKKIALLIIAYNEEEYIGACIKQWKGLVDKTVVLLSVKPWYGSQSEADKTLFIARDLGAEVIARYWETEAEQRSWGLARLYDYDYVIINDPDEFYTEDDRKNIIKVLQEGSEKCYRVNNVITYWKTPEYIFDPPDRHKPIIAVSPKEISFYEHRQPMPKDRKVLENCQPVMPVSIHHFSWVKPDKKIKAKIENFSHFDQIKPNWFDNIWLKWKPTMKNIRPYGVEESRAIKSQAPKEIINLIK
jgi:hypothetical protein